MLQLRNATERSTLWEKMFFLMTMTLTRGKSASLSTTGMVSGMLLKLTCSYAQKERLHLPERPTFLICQERTPVILHSVDCEVFNSFFFQTCHHDVLEFQRNT